MIQVLEGCWAREGGNTNLKSGTTNWGRSKLATSSDVCTIWSFYRIIIP
jgi:hypothetical protein